MHRASPKSALDYAEVFDRYDSMAVFWLCWSNMKVTAISDLHGYLPEIKETDLLLIAGDICSVVDHSLSFQESWLDTNFRYWLKEVPAKRIIGIAGNHDFIFEHPRKVPSLPWTYLQDQRTEFQGLRIWGTPWQLYFGGWAFNLYEKDLAEKWELIPKDVDILITHQPPYGYGDLVNSNNVGSPSLLAKIREIKPRLTVYGHIHNGYGVYKIPELLANVSLLNDEYKTVNQPTVFEV